jgi:hypothetical protein
MGTPLMTRRGRVVVLSAACLVSATIAFMQSQQQSSRRESPALDNRPQLAAAEPAPKPEPVAARPVVRKASPPRRATTTRSTTLPPPPVRSDAKTVAARETRDEEAPLVAQAVAPSVVTISGCLEQDSDRFRLEDTAGEDAPRSRSWRSGFLRRSASSVDVVDHADQLHLPTYVGQRVSMTGTLVGREMQVRSVAIVAESCEEREA